MKYTRDRLDTRKSSLLGKQTQLSLPGRHGSPRDATCGPAARAPFRGRRSTAHVGRSPSGCSLSCCVMLLQGTNAGPVPVVGSSPRPP